MEKKNIKASGLESMAPLYLERLKSSTIMAQEE